MYRLLTLALLMSSLLTSSRAHSQEPLPFTVENPHHQKFPADSSLRIFQEVTRAVAEQMNLLHPPILNPRLTLKLGAKQNVLASNKDDVTLSLTEWNAELFAYGVARAAELALLDDKQLRSIALQATSHISVSELKH